MKSNAWVVAMAAVCFASAPAAAGEIEWQTWNAGLKQAAASGRPVLVDVYTDWCGWCKRMDRDVYSRSDVRDDLARHFVVVRLDAESAEGALYENERLTSRALAMRFGVSGYPTTIFLRSDGTRLANVPGYVPSDRFLMLLRYVGEGHLERGESYDSFAGAAGAQR